ncbi:MAG: hypothetical protein ACI8RD_009668 [Bacillariaceae sp.]|jgi:hypothetical protein
MVLLPQGNPKQTPPTQTQTTKLFDKGIDNKTDTQATIKARIIFFFFL